MGFGKGRQWCGVCTYRGMVWSSRKVILYSATSSRGHVGNETRSCAVRGSESPSHKWGGRVPPPLGSAPLPSHDHHSPCHNSPSPLILIPLEPFFFGVQRSEPREEDVHLRVESPPPGTPHEVPSVLEVPTPTRMRRHPRGKRPPLVVRGRVALHPGGTHGSSRVVGHPVVTGDERPPAAGRRRGPQGREKDRVSAHHGGWGNKIITRNRQIGRRRGERGGHLQSNDG